MQAPQFPPFHQVIPSRDPRSPWGLAGTGCLTARPSPVRRRDLCRWLGLSLGLGPGPWPRLGWSADAPVEGLKAAYLYNFTRFVQWPGVEAGEPFVIGVLGDQALAAALGALERDGKAVAGAPIRIETLTSASQVGRQCRILFVGAGAITQLPAVLEATAGRPVLLVGDTPGLARRGVAINFFLKRDILGQGGRLRFEIAPAALEDRGLKVSAQLFDVAEVLR